jgi:hypothetical protein
MFGVLVGSWSDEQCWRDALTFSTRRISAIRITFARSERIGAFYAFIPAAVRAPSFVGVRGSKVCLPVAFNALPMTDSGRSFRSHCLWKFCPHHDANEQSPPPARPLFRHRGVSVPLLDPVEHCRPFFALTFGLLEGSGTIRHFAQLSG